MNMDFKSTPRTDAAVFDACDGQGCEAVLAEFARTLERDLNEALLNVRECELEIKDLTIRAMEAEKSLAGKIILDRPFAPMPTESYPKTMQNNEIPNQSISL